MKTFCTLRSVSFAMATVGALLAAPVYATPVAGNLDTTFLTANAANGEVNALAVLPNGKGVVGGDFTTYDGVSSRGIARVNTDGTRDTGFTPGNGAQTTVSVNAVAVQGNGKVVIGGAFTTYDGVTRNRLARLNGDGTLDTGFVPSMNGRVDAIAVQADGKILVGGAFTTCNTVSRKYIARLNSDGTLDTGFAPTGTGLSDAVRTLAIQADGKIVIGGEFITYNGTSRRGVARLNSDGTLDTGFTPGDGAQTTAAVRTLALQADGKVIIGGAFTTYDSVARKRIARLNTDGTLDTGFVPAGTGLNDVVLAIAVQGDGKVIIGGVFTLYNGVTRRGLARLNSDGTLDTGFDPGNGAQTTATVRAVGIQADGHMVIGGDFITYDGTGRKRLARVYGVDDTDSDGTFDNFDNCPVVANATQTDTDGDALGDACDTDDDNDGLLDVDDANPLEVIGQCIDTDHDGAPDMLCAGMAQDTDDDNDGLADGSDNCPLVANVAQANADGDARGDVCDAFPSNASASVDTDGDGMPDSCVSSCTGGLVEDTDDDNDSMTDVQETNLSNNPLNPLDPPRVAPGPSFAIGIDEPTFGTAVADAVNVHYWLWSGIDGAYLGFGPLPRSRDLVTNDGDICGISVSGVWCIFWQFGGVSPLVSLDGGYLTPAITDAFRIATNATHACVVSKSTGVRCWGISALDAVVANVPSSLVGVNTVQDVAVGAGHACAIGAIGIQCWGDNTFGQAPATVSTPLVSGDVPLRVVAGSHHSCALVQNSGNTAVRCWGDNSKGQQTVPGLVAPARLAAGDNHNCVVTGNFTLGNNRVVCWGDNSLYQTTAPSAANVNPVDIRARGDRTCAVRGGHNTVLAALQCWPIGANPNFDDSAADSDGDGITDYYELYETPTITNPQSSDTDNDGVTDSVDPAPLDGTQTTTEQDATYTYNHLGQRASKTVGGTTTYFVYSSVDGQMIGEYNGSGTPVREYLYLEGERVATVNHTGWEPEVRYLANNHVGQAQYAWSDEGDMMFERTQTPFGESMAEQNYAKVPLRFPGQYYDAESGFNQNWNRDYDPSIGRYLQPDLIGTTENYSDPEVLVMAQMGLLKLPKSTGARFNHLYGYVDQNPVNFVDPFGLDAGKWLETGGGVKDCATCGNELGGLADAMNGCKSEYNKCKTIEDELGYISKYGGSSPSDAIYRCAIQSAGGDLTDLAESCMECSWQ